MLQTTFEITVTKGEIAQNLAFFPLAKMFFNSFLMIKPLFMRIFHVFVKILLKSSAADLMYVGNA